MQPSMLPTYEPSNEPTGAPSQNPSKEPSVAPSSTPSKQPSLAPSAMPSMQPSKEPSLAPSEGPTVSARPSDDPSKQPSKEPSVAPSDEPSKEPSLAPSDEPSKEPSLAPSMQPSDAPSGEPMLQPSNVPSAEPSSGPTPFCMNKVDQEYCEVEYLPRFRKSVPEDLDLDSVGTDRPGFVSELFDNSDFGSYLRLGMFDNGHNDDATTPCIGNAWIGYDCENKILCAAARINPNYMEADSLCKVQTRRTSRVQFTTNTGLLNLNETNSDEFKYTKLSGENSGE